MGAVTGLTIPPAPARVVSSSVAPRWVAGEGRRLLCSHEECCLTDCLRLSACVNKKPRAFGWPCYYRAILSRECITNWMAHPHESLPAPCLQLPLRRVPQPFLTANHIPRLTSLSLHLYSPADTVICPPFWTSGKASSCPSCYLSAHSIPFSSKHLEQDFKVSPPP